MNITIKITYKTGTVDLSIPLEANVFILPTEQPSAVVYQEQPVTPVEQPIAAQETTPSIGNDDEVVDDDVDFLPSDLRPSGKRYKSVEEMVAETCPELAHEIIRGEKEGVSEDGVGDGRIGGMGERKEEAGEGEIGEEKHDHRNYDSELETPLDGFEFPCQNNGLYVPPMPLVRDFILAFGEEHVRVEFLKARSWLTANPEKRKTYRGMGRYLNTWLCHNSGVKRTSVKQLLQTKSLISNGKQTQEGW